MYQNGPSLQTSQHQTTLKYTMLLAESAYCLYTIQGCVAEKKNMEYQSE